MPAARKVGQHATADFGGVAKGDPKDTDEFAYLTYDTLPKFTDKHRSFMKKHLTSELFAKLKDVKSDTGFTLSNVIQTGVETPHLGVGACAGDEDSWVKFKDLFYPIIKGWHNYDPETGTHPTDLDPSHVSQTPEQLAKFNKYVASTRIRAARNIRGYPLPAGSTAESAAGVEKILKDTFAGLTGELKGTYYPLGGMSSEQETALQEQGFLFQKPKVTNLLTNAGAARFWPDSRGIFHNDAKTALCWCNEEDHCRIISMSTDGDVKDVFRRFCELSHATKAQAEKSGAALMHNDTLGFLGTCPSNIGTGLRAGVMICLPELNKDVELLERVCDAFDLQPRGSAGEHSAAVGAKWDISNKQRIGFSEVQLVQKMVDGVTKVIAVEEALASGKTKADVEKAHGIKPARKVGQHATENFGGIAKGDPKDTDEFAYLTYDELPKFTDKHKSLMKKHLTPELFAKLKDVKSDTGFTLSNVIQTGVETPHLGVGACAGDEDSWVKFKDLFYPMIKGWHDYDPDAGVHPTDLDPTHVTQTDAQLTTFNKYVASTRIRAARNIRGYPLPAGSTATSAAGVEKILKDTFAGLAGDLKGTYYPLGGMTPEQETSLQEQGFLFQKPKVTNLLTNAGAARFWPESRGIFHNDAKTALCWCNEEDHCRIISMSTDGDVKGVFRRFCELSHAMKAQAEKSGAALMHNEKLGFLGTCPSNIGTGLRAGVMIRLPELNKHVKLLEELCDAFDLQPRGSAGEHSAAVGAKWDVSNKQRIGFSEVELVQKMVDGVTQVIAAEEMLAKGLSKDDVERQFLCGLKRKVSDDGSPDAKKLRV